MPPHPNRPVAPPVPAAAVAADRPVPDAFTRSYWDAVAEGRLLLRRCADCGRPHHYPREFCPYCWSEAVDWEQASGRATLYTWSEVRLNDLAPFRDRLPYVVAVVELEEGPRMMTTVVDCPVEQLRIGMALVVSFPTLSMDVRADPLDTVAPVFRRPDRR